MNIVCLVFDSRYPSPQRNDSSGVAIVGGQIKEHHTIREADFRLKNKSAQFLEIFITNEIAYIQGHYYDFKEKIFCLL